MSDATAEPDPRSTQGAAQMQPLIPSPAGTGIRQGPLAYYRSQSYVAPRTFCYGFLPVADATLWAMKSTPEHDDALRDRLREAVNTFADGSADAFGRMVGHANGGYIREILNGKKNVRERLIEQVHEHKDMAGWFSALVGPLPGPLTLDLSQTEYDMVMGYRERTGRLREALRGPDPEDEPLPPNVSPLSVNPPESSLRRTREQKSVRRRPPTKKRSL